VKKLWLLLLLFFVNIFFSFAQNKIIERENSLYLSNIIVIKLKNQFETELLSSKIVKKLFAPRINKIINEPVISLNKEERELSKIYLLEYMSTEDPIVLSAKISKLSYVEWAEPRYIRKITHEPNDSLYVINLQQNLKSISASQAWDITKGDTNIVIAIVDTGVDWQHPDLAKNIFHNKNYHPSYPNDVNGWDFGGLNGTPDNNPKEDYSSRNSYHGTHVAGTACAVTNNSIGIASIGYNCKILPVKVTRDDIRDSKGYPLIVYGFEGIKYAVDRGAKIINCSWGGYSYSRLEQEAVDYAISKGVLVVGAAGNEAKTAPFYPASYKGVLSVGWLNTTDDTKSVQANYGTEIDVMAPGTQILSTWQKDSTNNQLYNNFLSGSSMSAPLVAGLAGLVKSKFPDYAPLQIAEQIRMTTDDIDSKNVGFERQLGKGKVNAFKAVNQTNVISVRATEFKFVEHGNGNGVFNSGERFDVFVTLTNFLNKVNFLRPSASENDQFVNIYSMPIEIGSMNTLETRTEAYSFSVEIDQNAPLNHKVNILLRFSADGYNDFQWLTVKINPTYDTHNTGKITMSVTSKGALGFNDYSSNLEGEGFKYLGSGNLMFEGAFMYGTGADKLMDVARITSEQSDDFKIIAPINIKRPGAAFSEETYSNFDDSHAPNSLGISTHFYTYADNIPLDDNYIIIRTALNNKTQNIINGLYAGFFIDWDIPEEDYENDTTGYDAADNFAYAFNKRAPNLFVGTGLISHTNYGYYAVDNSKQTGDVILLDGFSDSEKWFTLSNGIKNIGAGISDISYVVSGGPFNIAAGKTESIAFSIAAGSNLEEVRTAIKRSREKYKSIPTNIKNEENNLPTEFILYQNYPNPFNPTTTISFVIPSKTRNLKDFSPDPSNDGRGRNDIVWVTLKIYDILGREAATLVDEYKQPGIYNSQFSIDNSKLTSGVYFYTLRAGNFVQTKKMVIIK
jgi:hypothetical protein